MSEVLRPKIEPGRSGISGMQDRKLEANRRGHNPKSKMTPTKEGDISARALTYKRLLDTNVWATMVLEGCRGNTELPQYRYAQDALATVRDEVKRHDFYQLGFNLATVLSIQRIKEKEAEDRRLEKEERKISKLLKEGLQLEQQAELGDVSPTVVFEHEKGDNR